MAVIASSVVRFSVLLLQYETSITLIISYKQDPGRLMKYKESQMSQNLSTKYSQIVKINWIKFNHFNYLIYHY